MLRAFDWLKLLSLVYLPLVYSQNVPPIACPDYFEYQLSGNQYIGKITLPLNLGKTKVDVNLVQREPVYSNFYGRLTLYDGQDVTVNNLQNGRPVSYRVEFPTSNVLPKLTRISVNDVEICSASGYPPPYTTMNLQHTITAPTTHVYTQDPFSSNDVDYFFRNGVPQQFHTQHIFGPSPSQSFRPSVQRPTPQPTQPPTQAPPIRFDIVPPPTRPPPVRFGTLTPPTGPPQQPTSTQNFNSCGREGSGDIIPFIYGGTLLSRGQFPWLTAIYQKESVNLKFLCGGSLISTRTVLTAAHCFQYSNTITADRILIYLGRHDLENFREAGAEAHEIQTLIINPEYNMNTYPDADLALLQIKSRVEYTPYIQPICLWSEPDDASLIVGQMGTVAGWGATESGVAVSPVPKMVDARIVSENECVQTLDVFKALTSPRTLCAGNRDGTGPCMGDSGGGLMLNRNGRWVLRGIVSAGQTIQRQCNLREYVIYCDLAKHMAWVHSNMM